MKQLAYLGFLAYGFLAKYKNCYISVSKFLRNCIGFLMNITQSLQQPPLFISFSILVFSSILLHTSLPTAVSTVPGAVGVVVISLSFPSFNPQSINPSVWL